MNTAFGLLAESGNVIKRIQDLGTAENQLKDPDYWGSVGIITITGILVVFLILAILIFFFWLMGTIFKAVKNSRAAKDQMISAPVPTAAPAPVEEAVVEEPEPDNDEEIVAVISAAIAAYEGDSGYMIKSISRRTDDHNGRRTRSAWSAAGIGRNMRRS